MSDFSERLLAVENAIATQRLAGLEVDPQTKADLVRVARGDLTLDQLLSKIKDRINRGDFREKS